MSSTASADYGLSSVRARDLRRQTGLERGSARISAVYGQAIAIGMFLGIVTAIACIGMVSL